MTLWRDGTMHLVMSILEFMQRPAALVPRPRLHLIRFHGVLAPIAEQLTRTERRMSGWRRAIALIARQMGRQLQFDPLSSGHLASDRRLKRLCAAPIHPSGVVRKASQRAATSP